MNYLSAFATSANAFLNRLYSWLTIHLQSINIDGRLELLCRYNVLISIIVFAIMLAYLIIFDGKQNIFNKKKINDFGIHNFENPINITVCVCLVPIYIFLSNKTVNLASFGLGTVSIHAIVLIIVAKLYGPLVAGAFGAVQCFASYIENPGDPLMLGLFFIYAVGGMIHGLILYGYPTSLWRCFVTRCIAVFVCNIVLIPLVRAGVYTYNSPLSVFIPQTITTNLVQIPVQSVAGYVALLGVKFLQKHIKFSR